MLLQLQLLQRLLRHGAGAAPAHALSPMLLAVSYSCCCCSCKYRYLGFTEGLTVVNISSNQAWVNGTELSTQEPALRIVLLDGYGCKSASNIKAVARNWRATDVVVVNTGPWCIRSESFGQWRKQLDAMVEVLQRTPAAVVWRSSVPVHDNKRTTFPWFVRSTFQ